MDPEVSVAMNDGVALLATVTYAPTESLWGSLKVGRLYGKKTGARASQ